MRPLLAALVALAPSAAGAYVTGSVHVARELSPGDETGVGATVIVGKQLDVKDLFLGLEVGGAATFFDASSFYRAFTGPRVAIGDVVVPSAFLHLGYGLLSRAAMNRGGAMLGAGLGLDLLLPVLQPGVHLTYERFLTGDFAESPSYLGFGLHVGIDL